LDLGQVSVAPLHVQDMSFRPKSAKMTGVGRLAQKSREADETFNRQRLRGVGVSSGPLGTWVNIARELNKSKPASGSDTWA